MRKYDEVQELVKNLRTGKGITEGVMRDAWLHSIMQEAANEIEELTKLLEKQQEIIRRIYADRFPNTWFVTSGYGEKDSNGLPQFVEIVPAYGVGWSQVYEKTDRTIQYEGS